MPSPIADRGHATELQDLVEAADLNAITRWLLEADADQLAAARKWYVKGRRQTEHLYRWDGPLRRSWCDANRESNDFGSHFDWIRAILAVGLSGPASAAKWIPWTHFSDYRRHDELDEFVRVAASRGVDWGREFVPAAADVRMGEQDLRNTSGVLLAALTALIVSFELPAPQGYAFVRAWGHRLIRSTVDDVVDVCRNDPLMPESFHNFLAGGAAYTAPKSGLAAAELVQEGRLNRDRLVAQSVSLLTKPQRPNSQRVVADLLTGVGVSLRDLPGGLGLLQQLIATCHASVGKALLPLAIEALTDETDVVELCTTVAGRPDRAQQQALLAALGDPHVNQRLGRSAVVAGLETFRVIVGDDARVIAIIDKHLAAAGLVSTPQAAHKPSGLWNLSPAGERWQSPHLGEFPTLDEDAQNLLAWLVAYFEERRAPERDRILPDLGLAAIVRGGFDDPLGARRRTERIVTGSRWYADGPTITGIRDGALEPGVDAFHEAARIARTLPDESTDPHRWFETAAAGSTAFRYLVAREAMTRLGRNRCLLSTPKHEDHSICFPALVPRLQLCHGASVGPLDLLLTLLRLRPTRPDELEALAGLHVPLDNAVRIPGSETSVTDAVDAIRIWVAAGGVPALGTDGLDGVHAPTPTCRLPIGPEQFGAHESWFAGPRPRDYHFDSGDIAAVVPLWRDLSRISGGGDQRSHYRRADYTNLLHSEMPPSFAAHTFLMTQMAGNYPEGRHDTVQAILTLMGQGRFDPQLFAQALVHGIDGPALGTTRFAHALELLVRNGGLQSVWEPLLLLTEAMIGCDRRPASLHRMLALLTRFVHEVPGPRLPTKIRAFAAERGNTKSHHEARALVAAADRSR